ncbi:hypothetical protein GCM10027343_15120 [Noviherbaspirillum agri]
MLHHELLTQQRLVHDLLTFRDGLVDAYATAGINSALAHLQLLFHHWKSHLHRALNRGRIDGERQAIGALRIRCQQAHRNEHLRAIIKPYPGMGIRLIRYLLDRYDTGLVSLCIDDPRAYQAACIIGAFSSMRHGEPLHSDQRMGRHAISTPEAQCGSAGTV